jgi:para-aminobenzoate synthetase component I
MSHPFIDTLNALAQQQQACFFLIDFDCEAYHVQALDKLDHDILFTLDNIIQFSQSATLSASPLIDTSLNIIKPIDFATYANAFEQVQTHFKAGNSYLLNLTFPTEVQTSLSLYTIFHHSRAKFKLYFKDQFVVFSPERFVQIIGDTIHTYPMKGTIDASIVQAAEYILQDTKELAEHTMVVDLLRNDLSRIAQHVRVNRFRYLDKIQAGSRELLQVSSHISGQLPAQWQQHLGELLFTLLPAGSISGTPKHKTLEIIHTVEGYKRGFFTGIFGYFDGHSYLDSAVMIRFIEKQDQKLIYKSGGGLTVDSQMSREYQELLAKVYLPF